MEYIYLTPYLLAGSTEWQWMRLEDWNWCENWTAAAAADQPEIAR